MIKNFIFMAGVENSCPIVSGKRRNLLRECHDFYLNYSARLENLKKLGITHVRLGIPYYESHLNENEFDFSSWKNIIEECKRQGLTVIADLIHFGLPDWMNNDDNEKAFFQNIEFPLHFARYANEFARQFPEIKYYCLVNEPFITANFSARLGFWNESISSEKAFVNAIKNIAKAVILAQKQIISVHKEKNLPPPVFIHSESFEMGLGKNKDAENFNLIKFAGLDLILGFKDNKMKDFLLSNGLTEEEYGWFMENSTKENSIIGIDHYPGCVHIFGKKVKNYTPKSKYMLKEIILEYYGRYKMPMLHTEVNGSASSIKICRATYEILRGLRAQGHLILGMSWHGDEYFLDWNSCLRNQHNCEINVGLYNRGKLQRVGRFLSELIASHS